MTLSNENYTIECAVLTQPSLEAFDIVHNTEAADTSDFYMARTFRIECKGGHNRSIALLDRLCSDSDHYAVLEDHTLTVILFTAIVRLDMNTGAILQYEPCENTGSLYEIYPIEGGYILYGESELFRYDHALHRLWMFSGRDILVSLAHNPSFRLEENEIHVRDFLGWHYVLDLDGNIIHEFLEE